ncbi:hypothetical protein [Polyangium fumosum]|uniref:Tetratricopeptide repeat protein n=1 Tax=Polyangium fumosum TaxID=889272 RepID=A0A4U1J8E4_9BACT|nr:hypothetical protein [Polyangium fumosum]TKD03832.1 hypothetical protein E8A74_24935 [Polyangium fumosum]
MSKESPAALPSWAEPYLDDFEGILRVVELSGGFVLLPVEVLGPDLGRALADWLGAKGHPALVFAPRDDEEWRYLSTRLLEAKPEEGGVAFVIAGTEWPKEGVSLAFRLVNERRDAISKRLGCPLVWCGTREFLLSTAERAPDFWSVRAVERRLRLREQEERTREEKKAGPASKDDLLEEARRQGDRKSITILTVRQVNQVLSAGEIEEAGALLAKAPERIGDTDPESWGEIELLRAEVARRLGRVKEAYILLHRMIGTSGISKALECRANMLLGRVRETGGDFESIAAAEYYREAQELAQEAGDHALVRLASYRHAAACRAIDVLDEWQIEERIGIHDRPLEALIMALVAAAKATTFDLAGARKTFAEAIRLAERAKDEPTILFGGEVEEALEKARAVIAPFDGKKEAPSPPPAPPTTGPTTTKSSHRWLAAAALALVFFATWALWRSYASVDEAQFCFTDGALIHCTRSLGSCEAFRKQVGPSAGPCQHVTPTFP